MGAALGLMFGVGLLSLLPTVVALEPSRPGRRPRLAGDRMLGLAGGGVGAGVPVGWLTGDVVSALAAGLLGAGAVSLTRAAVERRRRRALLVAWTVVVDGLLGALQAGLDLREASHSVARYAPAALRADVAGLARDLETTADPALALLALRQRLADPSTDRLVEAVLLGLDADQLPRLLRFLRDELRRDAVAEAGRSTRRVWGRVALGAAALAPWVALALVSASLGAEWSADRLLVGATLVLIGEALADRLLHGESHIRVWR